MQAHLGSINLRHAEKRGRVKERAGVCNNYVKASCLP